MKKFYALLVLATFFLLKGNDVHGQISGTVFRDFNGNGVKNNTATFNEPFVAGITVKAFNASNAQLGATKTTDAAGAYSFTAIEIPNGTPVRIEFSGLGLGDFSSVNGTGNGTNVQFVTAPSTTTNFAINAPDDYWNNTGSPNPKLLAIVYGHGDINHTNSTDVDFGIIQIDNNSTGSTPTKVNVATQAQVGSLWGMGYQKTHDRFFFSSFLKRHTGFGPQGVGGVYMANLSGANYALSGSFTLQGVTPSNGGGALDMGTINRVSAPNTSDFYLHTGTDLRGRDLDAFGKVGKIGFGDIEIDERNQQLVMVNLNQRRLITLNVSGSTANLNNATPATLGPLTRAYDILTLPGVPSCVSGQLRPFALKIYKGRGYLGAVCDASATPRDSTNLAGYILSFDPANIAAGFTTEVTFNFNYRTSTSNGNTNRWHSWADVWADVRSTGLRRYPEPLISDIEFDENGGMNISITDRFGHQMGMDQPIAVAGSGTIIAEARISGELLHACRVGASWVMEGTAGSCTPANTVNNTDGYGDGQTVGVYEWYDDQSGDNTNGEFTQGAAAKLMGSERLVHTIVDPYPSGGTTGEPYFFTAGMHWYNVNSGGWSNWVSLYDGSGAGAQAGTFMKGNGLGDIEFVTSPAPIQIGNRIWNDANGNGIQDANETTSPIAAGTTITLRSPGPDGDYSTAGDNQSWTTTTDANGNYYFSALATADTRKPASWTGVGNTILPGYDYRIEFVVPAGYQVTKSDVAGNTVDNIDNDAVASGANAFVTFNTGNTNHNFDIGIKQLASLGDKVWRDDDKDGVQDSGEPGVAGVTVTLFNNSSVPVATTVTDAYGNYLFDNLTPGDYTVGFTPPANYAFTTSAGTSEADATNSDANATTGRTTTVTLSNGENQRNIDAGLLFSQPATNSIGDRIWFDTDGDGTQDANEAGVSGVTVTLYASDGVTVVATTVTDANGNYIFTGLPASTNYIVGITPPAGMVLTTASATSTGNSTVNSDFSQTTFKTTAFSSGPAGTQITGIDAGLVNQTASSAILGDKVWNDLNNNGIQDAGEPGVPGVTVNLYRDANGDGVINGAEATTPYLTTVTDVFGNYIFNNLPATAGTGTVYQVGFVLPGGHSFVTPGQGPSDYTDSDANTVTGLTALYNLKQGQRTLSVDAGITQNSPAGTARLGDRVWYDADQDGVQDPGEAGVAGVTVTLYRNGPDGLPGTGDDVVIGTTTTDANGNYLFANLAASAGASTEYNIGFSNLPQGYSFTPVWSSNDANATNSDVNPGTGRTGSINLSAGENEPDVDAGLIAGVPSGLGSIGNKVWWDLDNDNIQDAGEPGVAGVTVTLLDAGPDGIAGNGDDGVSRTTTTNSLGEYIFTGLPAGNYAVRFTTLPAGASAVTQNSGADDAADSDGGAISSGASTTAVYSLAAGEDNLTIDLGIRNTAKGSFGNRVWLDNGAGGGTANDGIQNGGEEGVAGIMVTLVNAAGQPVDRTGTLTTTPITTVTDASGYYSFADLTAGVSFAALFSNTPTGFIFTNKTGTGGGDDNSSDADIINGLTPTVTIVANTHNTTLDAGISSTRSALGNFVWMDNDGDGVQDAGEAGMPGVTVTLYRPGFGPDGIAGNGDDALAVASMITDQSGHYMFTNLIPGTYEVEFSTIPGGTTFTQRNTPGDNGNNTNSDAVPVTGNSSVGRTSGIVLTTGEVDLTIDAGLFRPRAVIGNYVWVDSNNNGVQDAGEPPAPGITVSLIDGGGNVIAVAVTDANGQYLFPNVAPGTYSLSFANLPAGAGFTSPNNGDDNFDSDVIGTTITGIVVTTTTNNLSFDAGITGLVTLPVDLVFTAVKQGDRVLLTWLVYAERDVLSYTLQRSGNATVYTDIYSINSDGRSTYSKVDAQPGKNINYYRIKVTNLDGSIEYSELRLIRFGGKGSITVFPNPATTTVNVQVPDSWQQQSVTIEVIGQSGQTLINQIKQQAGQIQTVDISRLPAGIYYLRIRNMNGDIEVRKLNVL